LLLNGYFGSGTEVGKGWERFLFCLFVFGLLSFHARPTDQHVRGSQRCDEVVARLPDGPVHYKRHQHQYVAGDGEHHAHTDDQDDDDLLPGLKRR